MKRTTWAFLLVSPLSIISLQLERPEQRHAGSLTAVYVKAGDSSGSGTILKPAPDGGTIIAITDHTLKADLNAVCVKLPQTTKGTTAYVLSRGDENHDIAFLYVNGGVIASPKGVLGGALIPEHQSVVGHGFSTKGKFIARKGLVLFRLQKALQGSYDFATSLDIDKGMSGGPITDSEGRFVGMIATHSEPLWESELMYQDRKPVERRLQSLVDRSAMGISSAAIKERLTQIKLSMPDSSWRSKQCSPD